MSNLPYNKLLFFLVAMDMGLIDSQKMMDKCKICNKEFDWVLGGNENPIVDHISSFHPEHAASVVLRLE